MCCSLFGFIIIIVCFFNWKCIDISKKMSSESSSLLTFASENSPLNQETDKHNTQTQVQILMQLLIALLLGEVKSI